MSVIKKKRALLHYGGWEGHQPELFADFAETQLLHDFEVVRSQDLNCLNADVLATFDLLVPIWTFGELEVAQETALLEAVANGLGIVAWHGSASAFLNSRPHKHLLGGQFVAHPGGEGITYTVRFLGNDQLVDGFTEITVVSEQYYMLIDPAVKVLATTTIYGEPMTWLSGVQMPVAWKRTWGKGNVFYCSLGHTVAMLEHPVLITLLRRAIDWAQRNSVQPLPNGQHFNYAQTGTDWNNSMQAKAGRF